MKEVAVTVRAQMESLLNEFDPNSVDAEVVLLDEATPALIKHCVRRVAKKYGGDTQRAFAICVASMQRGGYLEKGSMKLTAKGKAQSSQHAKEPDAETKVKGYERLLKKAQKEGKSEKDLRAEAMKMIAATEASKREAAKMKLKKKLKKEEVECLTCEAADKPCPECKESGGLVYEDTCGCWTCKVCGWKGGEKTEAKGGRLSFDSGRFEIRWSDKKHRYIVVTGDDWDYEDEEQAREMSAEIRHAKSLDDAAEILGVSESVEESKRTYAQAQADIMAGLQKDGWTIKPGLKVPQALSPDSSYKLFFKAQAIYLAKGDSDLGGARSLHLGDIRGSTYEQFKAALARWTTESVGIDVAEMRRLAGLDETYKVGTTRQREDGTYKKQASGDWEKVMSGGSTPTSAAGAIQATFGKYGPGKLSKMSSEDKDHVVRALATVSQKTLLHDSDQNAKLIQMLKGKKGHEDHVKDLEHMNKLYKKALASKNESKGDEIQRIRAQVTQIAKDDPLVAAVVRAKNQMELERALKSLRSIRAGAESIKLIDRMIALAKGQAESVPRRTQGVDEMRRLSGIDKYPDRKLESGQSKLMDLRQREAAGVAGAHTSWALDGTKPIWSPE